MSREEIITILEELQIEVRKLQVGNCTWSDRLLLAKAEGRIGSALQALDGVKA